MGHNSRINVKASFEEIQQNFQKLYQRGKYNQAYQLATQNAAHYPDQAPLINYWRICVAVRLERSDESLQLLSQSLENGLWYGESLLRKSPSLQPLQGEPVFERLVELNQQLQAHDQEAMFPLLLLRPEDACQDDEKARET